MMTNTAITLLKKLLTDAEKIRVGIRTRTPALTKSALKLYHSSNSIVEKENFEAIMQAASDCGAIKLTRELGYDTDGNIERIDLVDLEKLAKFIGVETQEEILSKVKYLLVEFIKEFKVLDDVQKKWQQFKKVRGTGPQDVQNWIDAAKTVLYMRNQPETLKGELPVREVSAYLFKDSKRIENIVNMIDVLLCNSTESLSRNPIEVWSEIGLRREEQPVRLAGKVIIHRERVCALLDSPYAAFPASTILRMETIPSVVISIENQTTFHSEARRCYDENILLIYTAGMPSPSWSEMYTRLLKSIPQSVPIKHWGDVDEGGFRIASFIARLAKTSGHSLQAHLMSPEDIPLDKRRPASEGTLSQMRYYAEKAGWITLANTIFEAGFTVEQEAL